MDQSGAASSNFFRYIYIYMLIPEVHVFDLKGMRHKLPAQKSGACDKTVIGYIYDTVFMISERP